jgi:hypothetical protein
LIAAVVPSRNRAKKRSRDPARTSGIVISRSPLDRVGRLGPITADRGSPFPIATGHPLVRVAVSGRPIVPIVGTMGYDEIDLVRTDPEHLAKFAQLRHLRRSASTLPEVDCLRLDAYLEGKLELGPSPRLAQRPDRVHARVLLFRSNMVTLDRGLVSLL